MDMVNGSSSDEGMFESLPEVVCRRGSRVSDGSAREFVPPFILLKDC